MPEEMARKEGKSYFPYGQLERLKRFDLTYVLNSLNNLNCLNPLKSRSVLPRIPDTAPLIGCEAANNNLNELAHPCRSWRHRSYGTVIAPKLFKFDHHLCVLR